jgi:NTE family protein
MTFGIILKGDERGILITPKKKVGLALGGGGARGMAHIGVLDVLKNEGIPIDLIAGTSAGAVIGAAYAWRQDTRRLVREALEANWKKLTPLIDLCLPRSGFIRGKKVRNLIADFVGGEINFSDLTIPFACVVTDIDTGEEIVIDRGPVPDALRATISVPGIFTLVKHQGQYVVDGGLTTPVPVEVVRKMGADFIIAVNVSPDVTGRMGKRYRRRVRAHKEPNIFQVMMQSLYIGTYAMAAHALEEADIVIEPDLANIGAGDFNKARAMITRGRRAAHQAVPEIKRKLGI